MSENTGEKTKKTIDISPLGKWKRILVYICDLIIVFFAAWIILSAIALPIGKASSGYGPKTRAAETAEVNRNDILYGHKLLFKDPEIEDCDYQSALVYTSYGYIGNLCKDNDPNADVFANYYIGIKNDQNAYINLLKEKDEKLGFFVFNADNTFSLKDEYKPIFLSSLPDKLNPGNNSESGQKKFDLFLDRIFTGCYQSMILDIEKNDLTYNNLSYVNENKIINNGRKYLDVLIISSTYISMILSGIIFYMIIPLCNKDGKTISMFMIRLERVDVNNIHLLTKGRVALYSAYHIVSSLGMLVFLPLSSISVFHAFRLTSLSITSLLSALIVLVSLIFMLFNSFNRTLFDYLGQTVMITTDSLDEIYRSKGYEI